LFFAPLSFAQQSAADTAASKEDVDRFLDAMHTRDQMKSMMDAMTKQMHQMTHDMIAKQPNLPADFEVRMNKMMDDILKDFPVEEMLQAMIPVYQRHLTKGDVDPLIAFYSTPTGQKILKEMPAITSEAMQASYGIAQKMMAKVMDRVQSEIAQLQKSNDGSTEKQSTPN
jgi:uncharacterized protein